MAENDTKIADLTPEERQNYLAQVKQKLNMPAEADDFEVVVRLVMMIAQQQERYQQLAGATAQAQGEMANRDIESFKDVIGSKEEADFWHAQILANRDEALAALGAFRKRLQDAAPKKQPMAVRVAPIVNRVVPGNPAEDEAAQKQARAIANRALEIQRTTGQQYWASFDQAVRELTK